MKNLFLKFVVLPISSGFGLGMFPKAPGTAGSLLGIPLGLYCLQIPHWHAMGICLVLFIAFTLLSKPAGEHWGQVDSPHIVSDEVLGQAITFLSLRHVVNLEPYVIGNAVWFMPHWGWILAGFVLFRVFDIAKPFPINVLDRKEKAVFVIADDIVAGLYAATTLWVFAKIFFSNPA